MTFDLRSTTAWDAPVELSVRPDKTAMAESKCAATDCDLDGWAAHRRRWRHTVDGLSGGPHVLRVRSGTQLLTSIPLDLEPGAATTLALAIDPPAGDGPSSAVHGSVVLPETADDGQALTARITHGGGRGALTVWRVRFGAPWWDGQGRLVHPWSTPALAAGTYVLEVEPLGLRHAFDVPAEGETPDVTLRVPALARVEVDLRQEDGAPCADSVSLSWRPLDDAATWRRVPRLGPGQPFVVSCPAGPIELNSRWRLGADDDTRTAWATLDATPGTHHTTMTLRPIPGVVVRLREGGRDVPYDPRRHGVRVSRVDGEPAAVRSVLEHHSRMDVSSPGLYRIEVEPGAGYVAPPPVERHLEAGVPAEAVFTLERETTP